MTSPAAPSAETANGGRIWHTATVGADPDGRLWLDFPDASSCARCARGEGCGAAQLTRLFVRSGSRLPLNADHGLEPGQRVRVGVEPRWLLRAAALAYLAPVLSFLAGALVAQALSPGRDALALSAGMLCAGLALTLLNGPLARLSQPRLSLERVAEEPVERLESERHGANL